jgi:hypothetical protein
MPNNNLFYKMSKFINNIYIDKLIAFGVFYCHTLCSLYLELDKLYTNVFIIWFFFIKCICNNLFLNSKYTMGY